jgi:hypothetical protein
VSKKAPKPLPSENGVQPATPEPEASAEETVAAAPETTPVAVEPPPSPRQLTPLEALVKGIKDRRALVAKQPSDFPPATRSGMVFAQGEASEQLVLFEKEYGNYLKTAAVAGIVMAKNEDLGKAFLETAQKFCKQPLVVVDASALYRRLAGSVTAALGQSRQFGSGQVGLVIEELAAIGKELFFTSLAAPNWQYDEVVSDLEAIVGVIRKAVRTSKDGDVLNLSYLRMEAFKRALDLGYTSAMVPVLVVGVTREELPALMAGLFSASVLVDVSSEEDVTDEKAKTVLGLMKNAGHPTQFSN